MALTPEEVTQRAQQLHQDLNALIALLGGPEQAIDEWTFWTNVKEAMLEKLLKQRKGRVVRLGILWNRAKLRENKSRLSSKISEISGSDGCGVYRPPVALTPPRQWNESSLASRW